MNFFQGTVRRNGTATGMIETEGLGAISVPVDQLGKADGASVQVALRPEKFTLLDKKPVDGLAVQGRMGTTAYLGERSNHYVTIPGKSDPVAVSTTNALNGSGNNRAPDAPVWLSWSADAVVILDPD